MLVLINSCPHVMAASPLELGGDIQVRSSIRQSSQKCWGLQHAIDIGLLQEEPSRKVFIKQGKIVR